MSQQEISDEAPDHEGRDPCLLGQSADLLQAIENLGGEVVAHQRAEIVACINVTAHRYPIVTGSKKGVGPSNDSIDNRSACA
jgi:hypothetical protein